MAERRGARRARLVRVVGFVAGLVALGASPAHAADYSIRIQDQPAGRLQVTRDADGRLSTDYSYRDNGRGPDLRETITLDANGVPVAFEVAGKSTMGAEVRERFAVADGRAGWSSPADRGDEPAVPGLVYVPIDATPAYWARLARAVLRSPQREAPAAGGVRVRAEKLATLEVEAAGARVPVALVALSGFDTQPAMLWLRDDGSDELFAQVWPGWHLIAAGAEAQAETLVRRQTQAEDERLGRLRQRLAQPLPGLTLIRAVRWFDARAGVLRGPSDVFVERGRIASVSAPGRFGTVKPDRTIDGRGRTLLPGLWDMHGHMWPDAGLFHLAAGVTSVRDPGNQNTDLRRLRQRIDTGEIAGPRIHASGFIEGRSPFSARLGVVIANVDEGRRAIDEYAARGLHAIKLYNSIRPEWVKPLAAHAHGLGLRVTGHVPQGMRAEDVVRAGYDELTHINQVMLNFAGKPGDDMRTLTRFTRIGDDAADVKMDSPRVRAFIRLLRERGTVVDPTLATFEAMFTQAQGEPSPVLAPIADRLPLLWRRSMKSAEMDLTGDRLARYRASWQRLLQLTGAMHRAGVPLVAGTDSIAGIVLHRELELYVQAGLTPAQALQTATWNAARVAGAERERGSIAPGLAADLLLVEGDPTQRIGDLRRASLVIQGDVAWSPAALFRELGFEPIVPAATFEE